jgi:hypothetical protein
MPHSSPLLSALADDRMVLLVCTLDMPLITIGFKGYSAFVSISRDALLSIAEPLALSPLGGTTQPLKQRSVSIREKGIFYLTPT